MANESTTQRIYETLRGHVSARLMRALNATEDDLAKLSLGELINMLFWIHGDGGSTGNFSVSFGAALKIVGRTNDVARARHDARRNRAGAASELRWRSQAHDMRLK